MNENGSTLTDPFCSSMYVGEIYKFSRKPQVARIADISRE